MRYSKKNGGLSLTSAIFPADIKMSGDVADATDSHGALSQVDTGRGLLLGGEHRDGPVGRGRGTCQLQRDGSSGAALAVAGPLDTRKEARGGGGS